MNEKELRFFKHLRSQESGFLKMIEALYYLCASQTLIFDLCSTKLIDEEHLYSLKMFSTLSYTNTQARQDLSFEARI